MTFLFLLIISLIPLVFGLTVLMWNKSALTKEVAFFLFLLFVWQNDVAILYAGDFLEESVIELFFRLFRFGPIMIMPLMYFFALQIKKNLTETQKLSFGFLFHRSVLYILIVMAFLTYAINFTGAGISDFHVLESNPNVNFPGHLYPVYGPLHFTFLINILFTFLNTFSLLYISRHIKEEHERKFYYYLVFAALLIFVNGVLSGFLRVPLYFSNFNSIIATIILFAGYYSLQSKTLRLMNQELTEQSSFLETVLEVNPNYIYVKDNDEKIISMNKAFRDLIGKDQASIIGCYEQAIIPQINSANDVTSLTIEIKDSQGALHTIEWSYTTIHFKGKKMTLSLGIDTTERIKNEEIILQSEKLKVLGEMATGIAHEIRNPLTSIKGFITLLQEKHEYHEDMTYLKIMGDEIDRINQIVGDLVLMGKPQAPLKKKEFNVRELIYDVNVLFKMNSAAAHVTLDYQAPDHPVIISSDINLIKQLLINVMKNALEAVEASEKAGCIRMKLEMLDSKHVRIRIIDNGIGISRARLKKLGEPFFTTKEFGTGLGLTICYKITKELGAGFIVKSVQGLGTVADIVLPIKHN